MESLLAHLARKERHRLSVTQSSPTRSELAERFKVRRPDSDPDQGRRSAARLEGKARAAGSRSQTDISATVSNPAPKKVRNVGHKPTGG
jgi:hypothetical protein